MNHDLDKLGRYSVNYNLSNFYPLACAWLEMLLLEKPLRVSSVSFTLSFGTIKAFSIVLTGVWVWFLMLCVLEEKKTKYFFKAKRKGAYACSVLLRKRTCVFIVVLQSVVVNICEVYSQFLVLAILGYVFYNSTDS